MKIRNYWADADFSKRGGVGGVVTLTTNAWWTLPDLPAGEYRVVLESSGLSAFVIHKYPSGQISSLNSQLANPRQSGTFTIDTSGVAFQPMVAEGGTGTVSRLMIVDADKWEQLREYTGEDIPYFDGDSMPLPE